MKIGVDLRNLQYEPEYFAFILVLLEGIINSHGSYFFYLFVNTPLDVSGERIFVNYKEGAFSFIDQIKFTQKLKGEKIDVMLFFHPQNTLFYHGKSVIFLNDLRDVFYTSERSSLKRNMKLYMYKYALRRAQKVLCFDRETRQEINERFDIKEDKITQIPLFFQIQSSITSRADIAKIAVVSRHSLDGAFLIYDAGPGIHRNLERLIESIKDINTGGQALSLCLIGEEISRDLLLRHLILSLGLQNKVVFVGELKADEEEYYYNAALGVINPSLYDPFPIHTQKAMSYKKAMIMSEIETLKDIFGKKVQYFNPLSKTDMVKEIRTFLSDIDALSYEEIFEKFRKENTIQLTNDIIKQAC